MCRTEMKWNVKVFKHIVNVCKSTACPRLKANQSLYWIWIFLSTCCARGKVSVTPWIHSSSGKQQKSINNIFLFLLISVIHLFIYFRVRAKCQFDFDKNGHEYSQGGIWFFFFFYWTPFGFAAVKENKSASFQNNSNRIFINMQKT